MGDLSQNFSRSEFACKGEHCCGHSAPVDPRLVEGLQALRDRVGLPLVVSSGFRCHTHNDLINGARNSYHCLGQAADILLPKGWTPRCLADLAEEIPLFANGGIGIYHNWLHLDIREEQARWLDIRND